MSARAWHCVRSPAGHRRSVAAVHRHCAAASPPSRCASCDSTAAAIAQRQFGPRLKLEVTCHQQRSADVLETSGERPSAPAQEDCGTGIFVAGTPGSKGDRTTRRTSESADLSRPDPIRCSGRASVRDWLCAASPGRAVRNNDGRTIYRPVSTLKTTARVQRVCDRMWCI